MTDLLTKIRERSIQDRRIIAMTISGVIVAIVFVVWANAFRSEITQSSNQEVYTSSETEEQQASVLEGVKRKAKLLFGEGSPLRDVDFGFGEPIEYKTDDNANSTEAEEERDLQAILEAFTASSSATSSKETEPLKEKVNVENSL